MVLSYGQYTRIQLTLWTIQSFSVFYKKECMCNHLIQIVRTNSISWARNTLQIKPHEDIEANLHRHKNHYLLSCGRVKYEKFTQRHYSTSRTVRCKSTQWQRTPQSAPERNRLKTVLKKVYSANCHTFVL